MIHSLTIARVRSPVDVENAIMKFWFSWQWDIFKSKSYEYLLVDGRRDRFWEIKAKYCYISLSHETIIKLWFSNIIFIPETILRTTPTCNRILVTESIAAEDSEKKSWEQFLWSCGFHREPTVLDVYLLSNALFLCVNSKILGFACN